MKKRLGAMWLVALLAAGACQVDVSFKTFGTTVEGLQAEAQYQNVYSEQITRLHETVQRFAPTASNPGVCNIGGTKQGCYDADAQAIVDVQAILAAFEATAVPPRYVEADTLIKQALAGEIQGLELRNKGIAENDDAAFQQHKVVLQDAGALFARAYAAYPEDNLPQPPP